jgi:hypothetical protein
VPSKMVKILDDTGRAIGITAWTPIWPLRMDSRPQRVNTRYAC